MSCSRRSGGCQVWSRRPWWRDHVLRQPFPRPARWRVVRATSGFAPSASGARRDVRSTVACQRRAMPRVRRRPGRPRHRAGRYPSAAATCQALGAHQASGAHGDRGGRFLAGFAYLHTDREPLVRIKAAVCATGVPDNPYPQRPIGQWDDHRWIRWPTGGPVHGGRCRPVIRRCWSARNSHLLPPLPEPPAPRHVWTSAKLSRTISVAAGAGHSA